MEQEILTLLQQMNEKMDKRFEQIEARLDKIELRLNQHERLLETLIKMTAQNIEDITSLRTETNDRFDKLELSYFKMNGDINLLFQETQTNKREIAYLKQE
ncbi:hypothetical protein JCM9140_2592 [Halalkalibacter wakoensis JCM 9140]|uniref:Uncharacterized protein n=1 Tax=Halalkalibacter wakoensis JCM 9140 TaxID=1236970 RepID=W4Q594_9BACI|nr:hypothetical protein [Halalkalibacter wakoensis]GAE26514.1 hypothetical protein JCM9140_2592 [Halalkalibacter wakoensis JCM 9140]